MWVDLVLRLIYHAFLEQCSLRTMLPDDGSPPPVSSDDYYFSVRDMFPHIPDTSDVLGRLCALVMQMCVLHIEAEQRAS